MGKLFFQNTLGISEKTVRTSLANLKPGTGVMEPEKRGGRRQSMIEKGAKLRQSVVNHINRFPKVKSHYCRKSSTREYLYPDLTIKKMYYLYLDENKEEQVRASFSL